MHIEFRGIRKSCTVEQSYGSSICGDIISDSFNKTSRDKDNILDQIYKSIYVRIIIMMILFSIILHEMHTNTTVALKPNFMSSLLLCAVFL